MSPAPSAEDPWKTLAAAAPALDPGATITAMGRAANDATIAVRDGRDAQAQPAVTLPELPFLAIDRLPEGAGAVAGAGPLSATREADFEVTGVLGEGGMGKVLLARQRSLRREVAIKIVKAEHPAGAIVDTLLAEAVITGSIEHPGVIPVHALGRDEAGRPLLVMKRVEGVSWRDLARDAAHPLWAVIAADVADRLDAHLEILMAVCSAAHAAHAKRFVHRDVKLDNVMIGPFGEVYLVDWGIAMRLVSPAEAAKLPRVIVGTPAYMAPEMVQADAAAIDARTDVYLLGATLHAVLTGASRHLGDSLGDVFLAARESLPFEYGPAVPSELAAICNRATSADPAQRFATALELRLALAAFRRHKGSVVLSDEASARLAEVPVAGDPRRVHGMLTECRFGFMQACKAWPENAAAHTGLESVLVLMIEHELVQRDVAGARALLAELEAPHPELSRRIDALAAELQVTADREARLRELERNRDLSVGGGAQLAVLALLPAIAVGIAAYLFQSGERSLGPGLMLGPPVGAAVLLAAALVLARGTLQTEISRKALAIVFLVPVAVVLHRAVGIAQGATVAVVFAGDLVLAAALSIALAIALVPRMAWVAVPLLLGAVGIAARPDLTVALFASVVVSAFVLLVAVWRRSVRSSTSAP